MTGIGMMLKAFGVNITDEQIKMVEALIPTIPDKITEVYRIIDGSLQNFDGRLSALELRLESLHAQKSDIIAVLKELYSTQSNLIQAMTMLQERMPFDGPRTNPKPGTRKRANGTDQH